MTNRAIAAYALITFLVVIAVFVVDRLLDARRRKRHNQPW